MPYALLSIYAEELIELMAEEVLEAITIADMPHMKESDRNKVRSRYARVLDDAPAPDDDPTEKEAVDPRTAHGQAVAARFGISVDAGIES